MIKKMMVVTGLAVGAATLLTSPMTADTDRYPWHGQGMRSVGGPFGFFSSQPSAPSAAPTRGSAIPRQIVSFPGAYGKNTIVINSAERRLYYVLGDGKALAYGIGVGRPGFQWAGVKTVTQKREWPDWRPPAQMLKRRPDLPRHMTGGPNNPLGARAMYLGSTLYRIHGSNEPETIGTAVSSGCFRMTNEDVIDLYDRVRVGTKVVVLRGTGA